MPIIENILHPTDFSEGSMIAFNHALKLALLARAGMTLLHVSPAADSSSWSDFPGVRETLERWQLLPAGSPKSAVAELGIDVRKMVTPKADPVEAVVAYLNQHPS